jgi:chemotaxis protein CheX
MNTIPQTKLINDIAEQVWSQFLDIPLTPSDTAEREAECAASISIEGAWNGAVIVACSQQLARRAAANRFGCSPAEIGDAAWQDTLNEIANTMGDNLKGLLPSPNHLGRPEPFDGWQPSDNADTVSYTSAEGPLYVSLFIVES